MRSIWLESSEMIWDHQEYLHKLIGIEFSPAPYFEIEEEYEVQREIKKMIEKKLINSAHDVSEGGLFITLMESCFNRNLGVEVVQADQAIRKMLTGLVKHKAG